MRKFALATAAAMALAFSAPAFTAPAFAQDVKVKVKSGDEGMRKKVVIKQRGDTVRKKVVIRHGDRGLHRGWSHSRHYGAMKTRSVGAVKSKTVIKHGPNKTVIKKKIEG
jgi:hypothetical protein